MTVKRKNSKGVCKLTQETGRFVDAHLIPRALTKLSSQGHPYMQMGVGVKPVRRWSSWYDSELVTQAGEKILADLDSWAISELRRQMLVWSGWGQRTSLDTFHKPIGD